MKILCKIVAGSTPMIGLKIKYRNGYEDWPGVFIRGDNAFAYAIELYNVISKLPSSLEKLQLQSLYEVLTNSTIKPDNTWRNTNA